MVQKIIVGGFLLYDGKVLVLHRAKHKKFYPELYEIPGGKVDFGETPEQALAREFKEEANLDIEVMKPYHAFSFVDGEKNEIHNIEIDYIVKLKDMNDMDKIKLSEEHDDFKFITKGEIDNFKISSEIRTSILKGFEISRQTFNS